MAEKKILYSPPDFPESKLSDEATRTRRNLIAAMAIWGLVVPLGMLPRKIAVFEIDLVNVPVSVPDLISLAGIYFWASFVVYAYKDFARWIYAVQGAITQQNQQIEKSVTDIEDGEAAVQEAKKKGRGVVEIKFRSSGNITSNSLEKYEDHIPAWRRELRQHRRRWRQLCTDIVLRSTWDYVFPTLLVFGPAWHFLR